MKRISRALSKKQKPPRLPQKPEKYKTLERGWQGQENEGYEPPLPPPPIPRPDAQPGQMFYSGENFDEEEEPPMDPFLGDYTMERKSQGRGVARARASSGRYAQSEPPMAPPRRSKRESDDGRSESGIPQVPPRWSKRETESEAPKRPPRSRDFEREGYSFPGKMEQSVASFYTYDQQEASNSSSPPPPPPPSGPGVFDKYGRPIRDPIRDSFPDPYARAQNFPGGYGGAPPPAEAYSWEVPEASRTVEKRGSGRFSWRRKSKERTEESTSGAKPSSMISGSRNEPREQPNERTGNGQKGFRKSNSRVSQGISRRINMLREGKPAPSGGSANYGTGSSGILNTSGSRFAEPSRETTSHSRSPAGPKSLGGGCYLLLDQKASGVLYCQWSEDGSNVEGHPIAYYNPRKAVPKFKFKQNGGRVELLKMNGDKQKLFEGVAQFVKEAASNNGTFTPLAHPNQACEIYALASNNSVHCFHNGSYYDASSFDAIAVLPHSNTSFEGVDKTSRGHFLSTGMKFGHALALRNT